MSAFTWPDGTPRSQSNAFSGLAQITPHKAPQPFFRANGLVKATGTSFQIPSSARAQADQDKRWRLLGASK